MMSLPVGRGERRSSLYTINYDFIPRLLLVQRSCFYMCSINKVDWIGLAWESISSRLLVTAMSKEIVELHFNCIIPGPISNAFIVHTASRSKN